jgi:hypothetical protein
MITTAQSAAIKIALLQTFVVPEIFVVAQVDMRPIGNRRRAASEIVW